MAVTLKGGDMAVTRRAGSYNAAKPKWRGVIRYGSFPEFVCIHEHHKEQAEATQCARDALKLVKESNELPTGWEVYKR